jgi:hypothetical protein
MRPRQSAHSNASDLGDFKRAAAVRREAAWRLSMSERLAQVHRLSLQMTALQDKADLENLPEAD